MLYTFAVTFVVACAWDKWIEGNKINWFSNITIAMMSSILWFFLVL